MAAPSRGAAGGAGAVGAAASGAGRAAGAAAGSAGAEGNFAIIVSIDFGTVSLDFCVRWHFAAIHYGCQRGALRLGRLAGARETIPVLSVPPTDGCMHGPARLPGSLQFGTAYALAFRVPGDDIAKVGECAAGPVR
jgi:hypothetical protein